MENYFTYKDIIKKLNDAEILKLHFYIEDYPHYSNCKIYWIYEPVTCLQVELTNDNYEQIRFWKFKEDFKLFNFGKKGKFTLKQIWNKVHITKIEYAQYE